jgi:hypothetical protein
MVDEIIQMKNGKVGEKGIIQNDDTCCGQVYLQKRMLAKQY